MSEPRTTHDHEAAGPIPATGDAGIVDSGAHILA